MIGDSWSYRQFVGLGIQSAIVKTSLFVINVDIRCGKNFLEDKLCKAGNKLNGEHSLSDGTSIACHMSTSSCNILTRTNVASYLIFVFFSLAIIFHILTAIFLNYYWY